MGVFFFLFPQDLWNGLIRIDQLTKQNICQDNGYLHVCLEL